MKKLTHEEFEERFNVVHKGNILLLTNYISYRSSISLICKVCTYKWTTTAAPLLRGVGCPECGKRKAIETVKWKLTKEDLAKKLTPNIEILSEYVNGDTSIKVSCKRCTHIWYPLPKNLRRGYGCPKCRMSRGEQEIEKLLLEASIPFSTQYKISKNKYYSYDFAVYTIGGLLSHLIEFDGYQHFGPVSIMGGNERWLKQQETDKHKDELCLEENIRLIRIPYTKLKKIKLEDII